MKSKCFGVFVKERKQKSAGSAGVRNRQRRRKRYVTYRRRSASYQTKAGLFFTVCCSILRHNTVLAVKTLRQVARCSKFACSRTFPLCNFSALHFLSVPRGIPIPLPCQGTNQELIGVLFSRGLCRQKTILHYRRNVKGLKSLPALCISQ